MCDEAHSVHITRQPREVVLGSPWEEERTAAVRWVREAGVCPLARQAAGGPHPLPGRGWARPSA